MYLFEILTFVIGESYVRAYAWAGSPEQARDLFEKRNPEYSGKIKRIETLMDDGAEPFCTKASDEGWSNV